MNSYDYQVRESVDVLDFPSPVSNSRKGCVECERCPELYAEFVHRVQQHSLSIWAEAKCGDVQMLPWASTQTQGPT